MAERVDVGALAESLGQPLVRLAYGLTGDGDEAQDVVQAVFVKLLAADLTGVRDLGSYARRGVVNEVASRGRRTALFRKTAPRLLDPRARTGGRAGESGGGAEALVGERQELLAALERLNLRQRTVLVLRYFEDYDDQSIGQVVGCSPATVRSIAARSLAKLRNDLTSPAAPVPAGTADSGPPSRRHDPSSTSSAPRSTTEPAEPDPTDQPEELA
ncbi:RNA polymerase sigma factor [Pimelobacter simplex]|uniref:RNA polymerase sigma factor n=1 Tax=Nocardioides simplex TaxID=2045 RepID=UPI003AAE760D